MQKKDFMKLTAYDKLRVILGVLLIAFMVLITIRYGLERPPVIKIAFLALRRNCYLLCR